MSQAGRLYTAAVVTALWLGAALITAAAVAPAAFAVLPSGTLAGALVGRVLGPLFVGGIAAAAITMALTGLPRMATPAGRASVAALIMAVASGIAQFVITPRLDAVRAAITGPVEALAANDSRRVAFGLLHGYNVGGLGLAMAAALACLAFLAGALHPRR